MVLRPGDVRGGRVTEQRYFRETLFPVVSAYLRELASPRVGSTRLHWLDSEAEVGTDVRGTSRFQAAFERFLDTREGRASAIAALAREVPGTGGEWSARAGPSRSLRVGAESFDRLFRFDLPGRRDVDAHFAVFRVDRVLGVLVLVGKPGERVSLSLVKRLARIVAGRAGGELRVRSTGAPVVSGTVAVGQSLTATRGTWSGAPTSFAYQWQRCDALGLSCTSIPGATRERYVVAQNDVGSRLRVAVAARSSFGSGSAASAPTSVVPETTPPTNVSPPTIAGSPQVGQTLTAQGAGTWTGNPSSFAFRWQRCDATGGACLDIPGAAGGTYVLTTADVGSTIRVVVVARNAAGEATAVSAPTAVVT
jgi:hypothetical protein